MLSLIANGKVQISETFLDLLNQPARIIPFIGFTFLFGPFPEELGWRGYALDGLQERKSVLVSSLILGTIWAIWHIPLFFMRGTFQSELGFGSIAFWQFMGSAILISIFFTWIYNNNNRSILSAMLFHFSINLTGNLLSETSVVINLRLMVLIILSGLLSLKEMKKT
jgi:membrane protease YdiL (CAAX protease family)